MSRVHFSVFGKFAAPAVLAALGLLASAAHAALPPPTPQEVAAQAAKKAAADAQAAQAKQELAATMDAVAAHWRKLAAANGWSTHPPTALPPPAPAAGASAVASGQRPMAELPATRPTTDQKAEGVTAQASAQQAARHAAAGQQPAAGQAATGRQPAAGPAATGGKR